MALTLGFRQKDHSIVKHTLTLLTKRLIEELLQPIIIWMTRLAVNKKYACRNAHSDTLETSKHNYAYNAKDVRPVIFLTYALPAIEEHTFIINNVFQLAH